MAIEGAENVTAFSRSLEHCKSGQSKNKTLHEISSHLGGSKPRKLSSSVNVIQCLRPR